MPFCQPAINYHHLSLIHSSLSLPWRVAVCYFAGCSGVNWTGFPLKLLSFTKCHHTTAAGFNLVFPEDKPLLHYPALSIFYSNWSIMCSITCFRGCFLQVPPGRSTATWHRQAGLCVCRWDAAVWASFAGVCCDPEGGHCGLCANNPVQDHWSAPMSFQLTDTLWLLLPRAGHNRASLFLAVKINSEYDR